MTQTITRYVEQLPSYLAKPVIITALFLWLIWLWMFSAMSLITIPGATIKSSGAILAFLCRIPKGIDAILHEKQRLEAERDAFQTFARKVSNLEGAQTPAEVNSVGKSNGDGVMLRAGVQETPKVATTEQICDFYRETVMAVPHYDQDYQESLETNMAKEIRPEIVSSISASDTVTPQLQGAIVDSAQQAAKERARVVRMAENERYNLTTAKQKLSRIHDNITEIEELLDRRSAREQIEYWKRLNEYEDTCKDILKNRQSQIKEQSDQEDFLEFQLYLYNRFSWRCPVLNDGLDCVSRLREVKSDTIHALTKWR